MVDVSKALGLRDVRTGTQRRPRMWIIKSEPSCFHPFSKTGILSVTLAVQGYADCTRRYGDLTTAMSG